MHPAEMLGDDWYTWGDWGIEPDENDPSAAAKPLTAAEDKPGE